MRRQQLARVGEQGRKSFGGAARGAQQSGAPCTPRTLRAAWHHLYCSASFSAAPSRDSVLPSANVMAKLCEGRMRCKR